jgi:hypothetical protein
MGLTQPFSAKQENGPLCSISGDDMHLFVEEP